MIPCEGVNEEYYNDKVKLQKYTSSNLHFFVPTLLDFSARIEKERREYIWKILRRWNSQDLFLAKSWSLRERTGDWAHGGFTKIQIMGDGG